MKLTLILGTLIFRLASQPMDVSATPAYLAAVTADNAISAANSKTIHFTNQCNHPVWVGALGNPAPEGGGWGIDPGGQHQINLPLHWSGRFWGRTSCDFNRQPACLTGDCGPGEECNGAGGRPPATLAEITLGGAGNQDFYDVSLVDGYNLPISFGPVPGTFSSSSIGQFNCGTSGCIRDLNLICPPDLRVKDSQGSIIACLSACEKFNTDAYCCRGTHGTPSQCPPTAFSNIFKVACPNAYSYAYDDPASTFTCQASSYQITFCPAGSLITVTLSEVTEIPEILQKLVEPMFTAAPQQVLDEPTSTGTPQQVTVTPNVPIMVTQPPIRSTPPMLRQEPGVETTTATPIPSPCD